MSFLDIALMVSLPIGGLAIAFSFRFIYRRSKLPRQRKLLR